MTQTIQTIKDKKFFQRLTGLPFIKKIILYGSRARGDFQQKSDIDLAIVCPPANSKEWLSVIDIIENADTLLKIDCVRYDQLNDTNPLKTAIDKEGIIIFSRNF